IFNNPTSDGLWPQSDFEEYTNTTTKLFVEKYPWHWMPASEHKVLIYGAEVIRSFLVPNGQLSEEAQEAGNKEFKNIREFNARKTSRKDNLTDILHHVLAASDPSITHLRPLREKKHLPFSDAVLNLLED
ncbi:dna-mediated transposase, partial [Lasius niger]